MNKWFYALWALAVALALIVPIAIPYALWPPREGLQANTADEFRRRAEIQVESEDYVLPYTPLSSTVEDTSLSWNPPLYRAEVTARGPYGIPLASFLVTDSDINRIEAAGNGTLAFVALMSGIVLVSMPFAYAWLRHVLSRRLTSALA